MAVGDKFCIERSQLDRLIEGLGESGFQVIGPKVRDGAIVYDDIAGTGDLPVGVTDRQRAGSYRLEKRKDEALFGYVVGPHSWKQFLHPAREVMWRARKGENGLEIEPGEEAPPKFAFIGVRPCELAAIGIQDKVFLEGPYRDRSYDLRRQGNFIVAVNCGEAGGNCFCTSMGTGPKADKGFDLALTELQDGSGHSFVVEIGSAAGEEAMSVLKPEKASKTQIGAADAISKRTAEHMGRHLETQGIKELLQGNLTHDQWDKVAERCLSCGNCTMVCPTCFCTTVEDHSDLAGETAERVRTWDSCFTMDFSYIHGGSVRQSTGARYRQWMTHKLANWIDQFGTSGCVGCGRCITWCPVGIDITEEAAAIRANPAHTLEEV